VNYLAENSLPIWVAGAVALTMTLVVYFQTRTNRALLAVGVVVAIIIALLAAERVMETPREAVERTLYQLAATVEANDLPGTLAFMAPNAPVRREAEELMPLVNIERARIIGTPKIDMDLKGSVVSCRAFIVATTKQNGMKGGAEDELTLTFIQHGDRWLLEDYSSNRTWRRALGR
jgi:hypothetical protein